MRDENILIIGGGPTGLSAALFLAERGIRARIIEKHAQPQPLSKALAVNARTLTLFEKSGLTEILLREGIKTRSATFFYKGKPLTRFDFSNTPSPYPFMLVYPQWRTESLIEEHLSQQGIHVEREQNVTGLTLTPSAARLEIGDGRWIESDCVLAADGLKSLLRQALDIPFPGTSYPEKWHLFDAEMETPVDKENGEAYLNMLDDGAVFCIPVEGAVWRIIGTRPHLTENLPPSLKIKNITWESDFSVSHRCAETFQKGAFYLAGDAAHVHSPVGGRGMNLGIEDAYVFAELAAENALYKYNDLRHPVDLKLVRQIERISEMPRGKSLPAKMARHLRLLFPLLTPLIERRLGIWGLGLDHPVKTE